MSSSQPRFAIPLSDYLASPIRTLSESVKDYDQNIISDHDVVEAYNVLCTRIRLRKSDILDSPTPETSSLNFEQEAPLLVHCISSDIRRVLPSPFDSTTLKGERSLDQSYDTNHTNEDNTLLSMDSTLCQCALRLMSDFFMFPTLYSIFSHDQISTLLQDALSLCMPTASWTFDIERLRCTALLMLKMQRLPFEILHRDLTFVINALQSVISVQEVTLSKIDGFATISSLLKKNPIFLVHFVPFLPSILRDLKTDDLDMRLAAVQVLSAFSHVKHSSLALSIPTLEFFQVADALQNYIEKENPTLDLLLSSIAKSAVSDNPTSFWKKKGPSFAISLVSAFVSLLEYRVFTSPRSLKLAFVILQATTESRWKHLAVHSEIWKILLWAFSRMPRSLEDVKKPMANGLDLKRYVDVRERAFRVLKQDVTGGIGTTFVAILLTGQRDVHDVGKALEIVEELMKCESLVEKRNGGLLLEMLMSGIDVPLHSCDGSVVFSTELIDGSLLGKSIRDLKIQSTPSPILGFSPLSETEVLLFWDRLLEIWSAHIQYFLLCSEGDLPQNMFEIWQTLLLVQGQLTDSHQYLSTSRSITSRLVFILTRISSPLDTPHAQTRYLDTLLKLWSVMKNVFVKKWLQTPAETILANLLTKRFDLSNEAVETYWIQLCSDLVSAGIPTLLHVLHTRTSNQTEEETDVTRRLWTILVKHAGGFDYGVESEGALEVHWMNLVQLLAMPLSAWDMEDSVFDIWSTAFSRTIKAAVSVSQPEHVVISSFLDSLGETKMVCLKTMPKLLNCLLSHVVDSPITDITLKLLSMIDSALHFSYPVAETKPLALECLHSVAKLITRGLDSEVFQIIATMPNGLCKWIADEELVLTDVEHQEVVNTIYCESLRRLSTINPSIECLRGLADFLYSAFVRVENDGLLAFVTFWRSTFHHYKDVLKKDYPLAIRACLKAWSDVCDDSFAEDISLGPESQSLKSYTIPDSQPSPGKGTDRMDLNYDVVSDNEEGTERLLAHAASRSVDHSNALLALQEYQSNSSDQRYSGSSTPQGHQSTQFKIKRGSDFDISRSPKRRRVNRSRSPLSVCDPSTVQHLSIFWLGDDVKMQSGEMKSSDDYDTWEQHVLTGEGEDEDVEHPSDDLADANRTSSGDLLSPLLRRFSLRSRKRNSTNISD